MYYLKQVHIHISIKLINKINPHLDKVLFMLFTTNNRVILTEKALERRAKNTEKHRLIRKELINKLRGIQAINNSQHSQ